MHKHYDKLFETKNERNSFRVWWGLMIESPDAYLTFQNTYTDDIDKAAKMKTRAQARHSRRGNERVVKVMTSHRIIPS